jgi:capsular polysaccharide transport system permease protein
LFPSKRHNIFSKDPAEKMKPTQEVAQPARLKLRHYRIFHSFLLVVLAPALITAVYLWGFAKDMYIASMSFSVRTENMQSATDLLGGLSSITGSSSSDVDILTQFIESGDLIQTVSETVDLVGAFSERWPEDFIYAYDPSGQFEDLQDYWKRSVLTATSNGIVTLSVRTYDPQKSYEITMAVYEASRALINRLSEEAHADATRFSRDELQITEERLTKAREAMTSFRLQARIIDPNATLAAQMGILTELQSQQASAVIQKSLLGRTVGEGDPRMNDIDQKIAALNAQIEIEQNKFGRGGHGPGGENYATLFARHEVLASDLQFSEQAYHAAQLLYNSALSEAKRQARYLVAHVNPIVPEKSLAPDRAVKLLVAVVFLLLVWAVGLLIYYSIRDRR